MNKLLTIAIPTYNRAELLDKQLAWLAQAIRGFESDCEIVVSDNCSTDNTQEVIKKWQSIFNNITFKVNRNSQNLGVMRNITYCLNSAQTKYVWTIGDDDPIQDGTIAHVVNNLKQEPELSLLILNFCVRDIENDYLIFERTFENQEIRADGKAVIEKYLETDHRGLGLLTAQVYRTELIQNALQQWPSSVDNLEGQIYWTAFCAAFGKMDITKEVYVENAYIGYKPKLWFRMRYGDLPQIYAKMMEIGYSKKLCRKLIIKHFQTTELRVILGALKRWPILGLKTLIPYFTLATISAVAILFAP